MKPKTFLTLAASLLALWLTARPAAAQFISGSDGSDGALDCTVLGCPPGCDEVTPCSIEIDLSLAIPGDALMTMGTGDGVYDATRWAVVFKYTTIDIPAGVTVTFKNHPSGAPVVWLAQGDVTISGTVSVDGNDGNSFLQPAAFAQPGPGGFEGGIRGTGDNDSASGGLGPGGGFSCTNPAASSSGGAGSYGSGGGSGCASGGPTYGSGAILPLIGGSGGGGPSRLPSAGDGGAGGGAILIASSTQVVLASGSVIVANGGRRGMNFGGGGSGGAIRLVADSVTLEGLLSALGTGNSPIGGNGRIRIDADVINNMGVSSPQFIPGLVTQPVFPANAPTLKILSIVDSQMVSHQPPDDPNAGILTTEVEINDDQMVTINIEATNIPPIDQNGPVFVTVIVVPARGQKFEVSSDTALVGTMALSSTTATLMDPPSGRFELQLRANWTP